MRRSGDDTVGMRPSAALRRAAHVAVVAAAALLTAAAVPLVSGTGAAADPGPGSLSGRVVYSALDSSTAVTQVDLTAAGYEDWAVWGYAAEGTSTSLVPDVRKAGGVAISSLTDIEGGPPIAVRGLGQFPSELPFRFSWADGAAGAPTASSVTAGIQHNANLVDSSGYGFSFTVPASTVPQRLTVWVHAHGGTGKLTASLSDESAPDYVDTSVGGGGHNAPGVYQLDFAANSAGRTLTVSWVLDHVDGSLDGGNSSTNNAAIYAAALSTVPAEPELVANGSFETPSVVNAATFDDYVSAPPAFGWAVTGASVDHVKGGWHPFDGLQSLDLDGNAPGGVRQTLATSPGRDYLLRFAYSGNPDRLTSPDCASTTAGAAMAVSWGGSPLGAFAFATANTGTDMKWRTVELRVPGTATVGPATVLRFTSTDIASACGIALDAVSLTPLPTVTLSTPAIVRAVSNGSAVAVTGRVPGGAGLPVTLAVGSSPTCANGALGEGSTALGTLAVTPSADSYFRAVVPLSVALRSYLTIRATAPTATAASACAVVGGENDSWPRAFPLAFQPAANGATTQDVIDSPGQSRWYAFDVQPGSRVTVSLTGLPANYDLALFKDISQAYTSLTSVGDLTQLSAEFAPSAFSPSAFSPSAFSPSAFSPDAYSPSAFSPSAFSSSVYSPSAFSPSAFSPSAFSPSAFSPSAFSPSAFSPSAFSPSAFSPSAFSPSAFSPDDFASAQTRSLVAVSATPGTGDETVVADTWNNTGRYYVRVSGANGAFSTEGAPFTVAVTRSATSCTGVVPLGSAPVSEPAGHYRTLILTDPSRLPGSAADKSTLQSKLAAFAARSEIRGAVVDLGGDSRVGSLNAQADANTACPYAKNLVAGAIRDVVQAYRASNPDLRYVVLVGGDGVIPFFRYPDESLLGEESGYVPPLGATTASEASLRLGYVLGQDAYGASRQISLRSSEFPVPDLAVGRLVETASEASGMLDAYTATGGVIVPHSSLVTGYDFLADAAASVRDDLNAATGQSPETLITPAGVSPQDPSAWTAADLGTKLLGSHHDLVFLAGHFSANSALAADFTTSLLTTDLAASGTNLANSIVFSAGCHSGYNIVDSDILSGVTQPLDWAQALAEKQATLIAGTGYQYGDTDFLEYSERIYAGFARELRTGPGAVSVGEALVRAKQQYLETTPDIRGIHEKALLEATVFGLPMTSVDVPGARLPAPGPGSVVGSVGSFATDPGATLGLHSFDLAVTPSLTQQTVPLTNLAGGSLRATYYRGGAGVVTNPAEPALPLEAIDVTPPDGSLVLRGVGFRGGTYGDSAVVPLTGAPTTELRGVHAPFLSPVFYPMRLSTIDYYGALGGGRTTLLVTPAQHEALSPAGGTSTLRLYDGLSLRLFYSGYRGPSALSAAPDVVDVTAVANVSGGVNFRAHVVGNPAAGIQQVWVTYTGDGPSRWTSIDLNQDATDSSLWTGKLDSIASPANLRFVVQAVNGVGLVTLDDNLGAYHRVANATTSAPVATSLALQPPPAGGTFGGNASVTAVLSSGAAPLAGKAVAISVGGTTRLATTGAGGSATVSVPLVSIPGPAKVTASFGGDDAYLPSSAAATVAIAKATSSLSAFPAQPAVVTGEGQTGITTALTAALGAQNQPLLQQTVTFELTGTAASKTFSTITDYLGRATLPATGLPAGTYAVKATFAGDATYTSAVRTGTLVVSQFTGFFAPVNNPPTLNLANAGTGVPVKFGLGGNRGLAIFAAGYPKAVTVACASSVPVDPVETTVTAGGSSLQYDSSSGQYTYTWKTVKGWTGCRQLQLRLVDGTTRVASFRFK
jgi:hypothetical protein